MKPRYRAVQCYDAPGFFNVQRRALWRWETLKRGVPDGTVNDVLRRLEHPLIVYADSNAVGKE